MNKISVFSALLLLQPAAAFAIQRTPSFGFGLFGRPAAPASQPALPQGPQAVIVTGPQAVLPSALPGAVLPGAVSEIAPLPASANLPGAQGELGGLGAAIEGAGQPGDSGVWSVLDQRFDGSMRLQAADGSGMGGGPNSPNGGGGSSDDGSGRRGLSSLYPRVIFLQDVFTKPASEETVRYLETVLKSGVHLVFMTSRPLKGPDSAESVLLDRLPHGRSNPIIVVSHNGGKVSLHGRAANPKSILEDVGQFSDAALETITGAKSAVEGVLKLKKEGLLVSDLPEKGSAFSYKVALPAAVPDANVAGMRERMIRAYNERMVAAGLEHRMIADPNDDRAGVIHSMPLRYSLPRVFQALGEQFAGEGLMDNPEKMLILADSRKSPRFSSAFPAGAEVQVVADGKAVEETLEAVLGARALPAVSIKLGKLRQYVDYWVPGLAYRSGDRDSSGAGGGASKGSMNPLEQKFAMYMGTVIFQLMAQFHEDVWRGQHSVTTRAAVQERLKKMWYNPLKNGVFINGPLAEAMKDPGWKKMQHGYLKLAAAWVDNYYDREFKNYSVGAANIMHNQISQSTDRKSLITIELQSPSTKKLYKIHTRIPRLMKKETAKGLVLTAHAYRTGKENHTDGEQMLAQVLAMAMLKGHARIGQDGKWHFGSANGPVIAELRVQMEYRNTAKDPIPFRPEDIVALVPRPAFSHEDQDQRYFAPVPGAVAREVTNAIERMEADPEYQDYYAEHEEGVAPKEIAKKKAARAARKAAEKKGR